MKQLPAAFHFIFTFLLFQGCAKVVAQNVTSNAAAVTQAANNAVTAAANGAVTVAPATLPTVNKDVLFPGSCTGDKACQTKFHRVAVCSKVKVSNAKGGFSTVQQCRCNPDSDFVKRGNKCVVMADLGQPCALADTVCKSKYSSCQDDGSNTGTKRCTCLPSYLKVEASGNYTCAKILTSSDDVSCSKCEKNMGTCYDVSYNKKKNGCKCPTYRSGNDCQNEHATVNCNMKSNTIEICYKPPDNTTKYTMYAGGKFTDHACRNMPTNQLCGSGQYGLILPMADKLLSRCGTLKIELVKSKMYYSTVRVIQNDIVTTKAVIFNAYCSLSTASKNSFGGVSAYSVNANSRGETKTAGITFGILDVFGQVVPMTRTMSRKDQIRFFMMLRRDGVYGSFRVERCSASTSPVMPDSSAHVKPLIIDGCPAERQDIITTKNNFNHYSGPYYQRTGLVEVFSMPQGSSVYIHCYIKVCLLNKEFQKACMLKNCTNISGRRKRAVHDLGEVHLVHPLTFGSDRNGHSGGSGGSSGAVFSAEIIAVVVVLVLAMVAVALLFGWRRHSANTAAGASTQDWLQTKKSWKLGFA